MGRKTAIKTQCSCGTMQAELSAQGVSAGTHIRCYCKDCQTAARHLGYRLPDHAGTELIQTTPDAITLTKGADQLAMLRLGPKGLCRWYAKCCNTPMFNTLPRRNLPFAGVVVHPAEVAQVDQAMGPVWGHAFTSYAPPNSGAPAQDKRMMGIGLGIMTRMIRAYLSGRASTTPFLTAQQEWVATPEVLTKEERAAATP